MPARDERKLYPVARRSADEKKLASFYRIANRIRLIPDLGTGSVDDLVEELADYLPRLCVERTRKGELWSPVRQANWLMDEITLVDPWKKWLGPAGLKEIYNAQFSPYPAIDTYNGSDAVQFQGPDCLKCGDNFTVSVGDSHEWCNCEHAKRRREEDPRWLDLINTSSARSKTLQQLNRPRRPDSYVRKLLR
jgi:hypothetical protein